MISLYPIGDLDSGLVVGVLGLSPNAAPLACGSPSAAGSGKAVWSTSRAR
jgi:hypothetical protein